MQRADSTQGHQSSQQQDSRSISAPSCGAEEQPEADAEQQIEDRIEPPEDEDPQAVRSSGQIRQHVEGLRNVDEDDAAERESSKGVQGGDAAGGRGWAGRVRSVLIRLDSALPW